MTITFTITFRTEEKNQDSWYNKNESEVRSWKYKVKLYELEQSTQGLDKTKDGNIKIHFTQEAKITYEAEAKFVAFHMNTIHIEATIYTEERIIKQYIIFTHEGEFVTTGWYTKEGYRSFLAELIIEK